MSYHHAWEVFKLTVHCCMGGFVLLALALVIEQLKDIQTAIRMHK